MRKPIESRRTNFWQIRVPPIIPTCTEQTYQQLPETLTPHYPLVYLVGNSTVAGNFIIARLKNPHQYISQENERVTETLSAPALLCDILRPDLYS